VNGVEERRREGEDWIPCDELAKGWGGCVDVGKVKDVRQGYKAVPHEEPYRFTH
jgi:hypothetical protein